METSHSSDIPSDAPADRAGEPFDTAGVIGILVGSAALVSCVMGLLIPLIFWIGSAPLGVVTLICAVLARPPLRWWVALIGVLALIPGAIWLLVEWVARIA